MRDVLNAVLIVAVIFAFYGVFSRAMARVDLDEVERWRTGSAIPECALLLRVIELILSAGATPRQAEDKITA